MGGEEGTMVPDDTGQVERGQVRGSCPPSEGVLPLS